MTKIAASGRLGQFRKVSLGQYEKIILIGKEHLGAFLLFEKVGLIVEPLVPLAVHELHKLRPCGGFGVVDRNRLNALIDNEEDRHQHSSIRLEVGDPGATSASPSLIHVVQRNM